MLPVYISVHTCILTNTYVATVYVTLPKTWVLIQVLIKVLTKVQRKLVMLFKDTRSLR